jgi:hypothetical protein
MLFAITPSQLKKRVQFLASRPTDQFFELAVALGTLHDSVSAPQFREIVKNAGLGTRKAYYLVNIATQFRPHMRFRSRLRQLGWTKCQVIGRSCPGANILKLLEYAENHSTKELEAYAGYQKAASRRRCVLLYFSPAEYRRYEEAVLKFGARKRGRGLIDKEMATIKMAREVLST